MRSDRLRTSRRDVAGLDAAERVAMFALMRACYDGVSEAAFLQDLAAKHRVVLVMNAGNHLCGFSTLQVETLEIAGRAVRCLFSGDTVIAPEYWGSPAFSFAWVREIGAIFRQAPEVPLYWLLIVKGHRTFRYLPTFARHFFPDWRQTDDPELAAIRDALAGERFGTQYDPTAGIIRRWPPRERLNKAFAEPTERERVRADVAFFLASNPGFRQGDELVCICPIAPENMRPLTRRLFEQGTTG